MHIINFRRVSLVAVLFVFVTGCATGPKHEALQAAMGSGNCADARGMVASMQDKYGSNQQLLFNADAAMINLYCGENEQGRQHLSEAERIVDELWTKSISKEGASFLLNDYTIPYSGEDFEKVMVNLFSAISYAIDGNFEPSLIEVRKVNNMLVDINDKYEEKSVYREDAFARYMSAILYEAENPRDMQNLDSAAIDYKRGLEVYETYGKEYGVAVPDMFMQDYWRVTEATGRLENARELRKENQWLPQKKTRKMGRIIMLHLSGRVPVKEEEAIVAAAPYGPIKVAFPRFGRPFNGCSQSSLRAASTNGGDSLSSDSELVEDLSAIAIKSLNDRKGRVVGKAIARAIVKQAAVEAAVREADSAMDKALVRIAGRVAAAATENADLRSWRTLPGKIYMASIFVPEGSYNIDASYCGRRAVLGRDVNIKAGQSRFVLLQNVY